MNFLKSRKIRTALATVIAAALAPLLAKLGLSDEAVNQVVQAVMLVGAAVITGIAVEDHGKHLAAGKPSRTTKKK